MSSFRTTVTLALIFALAPSASAQKATPITVPNYDECRLLSIYPAGGQRGSTVTVELMGNPKAGLKDVREILIEGPPGITVRDIKNISNTLVQATFTIAADAAPGRRCVRVRSDRSGLTNMLYFTVGRLPEVSEAEPNNEHSTAQAVSLPVVVNGRVDPKADFDCFAFDLKKGQHLTAAVLAHAIDSHGQYKNYGITDPVLELLDSRGRVVAEAGDTLGLDPLIEYDAPADGRYTARVRLEAYEGFPQAVYRLVLGEVPMATSVFPSGGARGATVDVELRGPNIPPGTRKKVTIPRDDRFPLQFVTADGPIAADLELPFARGDHPEKLEAEPNNTPERATPIDLPMTVNGRFSEPGDADWYRIRLTAGQPVCFETTAQRFLRSPVDTLIEVYDAAGKKLAENDDGVAIDYICYYDFRPMDSRVVFTPPATGEYRIRVVDQSGGGGPRSVYRLTAAPAEPDFDLYLYPDGVPIWGPGTTAAMVVKSERRDGLGGDIDLKIEGLPAGWIGSATVARGPTSSTPQTYPYLYHLLTITAPPTARVGDKVAFQVVGRSKVKDRTIQRIARPLSLYYSSDTGFFRMTPQAWAVVAAPQAPWLSTPAKTLTTTVGGTLEIPVEFHDHGAATAIDLNVDLCTSGVATGFTAPQSVTLKDGKATLTVKLPDHLGPGRFGIVVGLRWRSDIRVGMPGPCTPLIALDVTAKPGK